MIYHYLSRSFLRRPLRHFSLFWIMLCAFLLPLVVSIYYDSLCYGAQLLVDSMSKGYSLHILGAAPEDQELFHNLYGLTEPVYDDGTIYLRYESEEFWKMQSNVELLNSMSDEEHLNYIHEEQRIMDSLHSAVDKSSRNLEIVGYAYDMYA